MNNEFHLKFSFLKKQKPKPYLNIISDIKPYKNSNFEISRYTKTGFSFCNNIPSEDEIYKINNNLKTKTSFLKSLFNKIRYNFIKSIQPIGSVMQIECGKGELLEKLKNNSYTVLGIDNDIENTLEENKSIHELYNYDFLNFFHYENEFDVIMFINSLCYSPNPIEEIEKAIKLVSEYGYIVIEEKIFDSSLEKVFKQYFSGFKVPAKVSFFNPIMLKKIMQEYGYKVALSKKIYLSGYLDLIKSCSKFLKEKLKLRSSFLRFPFLLPIAILSPIINLILYTGNFFKHGVFGNRYLAAFTIKKHKKRALLRK